GGKKIYIVRVAARGASPASIAIKDRGTTPAKTLTIQTARPGARGNKLDKAIGDSLTDPNNLFTIQRFPTPGALNPPPAPLLLETILDISMDPAAPNFVETVVAAKSQYIVAQADATNLANGTAGFSRGGKLPVGNGADVLKLGGANGGTEVPGT